MSSPSLPISSSYVRPAPSPAMPHAPYLRILFSLGPDRGEFLYLGENVHACRKAGEILSYILANGGNIEGADTHDGPQALEIMNDRRPGAFNVLPLAGVAVTVPCASLSGYWRIKRGQNRT